MSDYETPNSKQTNWGKIALGCGIAMFVFLGLAGGGAYWWFTTAVTMDPQKVAAAAEEILPGVEIPKGYEGAMAVDTFGFRMVMIMPKGQFQSESDDAHSKVTVFIIASYPADDPGAEEDARATVSDHTGASTGDVEDLGKESITVGGATVAFNKQRTTPDDGGGPVLEYVGILPTSAGRQKMLMITGPEASFDREAMDAFLGSIK